MFAGSRRQASWWWAPVAGLVLLVGCPKTTTTPAGTDGAVDTAPDETVDATQATARIATVQLSSSDVGNWDKMAQLATEAKGQGAQLVIFPEASAFGWLNPAVFTGAQPIPGSISDQFAQVAKTADVWVATGLAQQAPGTGVSPEIHNAYDSGILIDPSGELVIQHRKYEVLQNAFDPSACEANFGTPDCSYTAGPLSDVTVVDTPFGRTALIVCADAYTYNTAVLDVLKTLDPELVIVPWGVAAGQQSECGTDGFNATGYAAEAAKYLGTAYVIGANGTGDRPYGKYLPSVYCGHSGYATPTGAIGGEANATDTIAYFDVPIQ